MFNRIILVVKHFRDIGGVRIEFWRDEITFIYSNGHKDRYDTSDLSNDECQLIIREIRKLPLNERTVPRA